MAALGAIFRRKGDPISGESAQKMRNAMKVLGTDRDHAMTQGPFGLSWTFDSGYTPQDKFEFQPVLAEDRWMLLFTGFLMHREELAARLAIESRKLVNMPDCLLAMAAWRKWRERCLPFLYGKFSMIVCDQKNAQLFAVHGVEGGPALYYHHDQDRLIVTTSVRGIFCFPDIPKQVDEQLIADALVLNFEDRSRTFFKNVHAVPRGQILEANSDGINVRRYYDYAQIPDVRFADEKEYVEAANDLLQNAVGSAMRACETPALSLSAGLDSSSIALAMLDHLHKSGGKAPLKAYVSVPGPEWDGRARVGRQGDESGPVRALMASYPALDVEFVDSSDIEFDYGLVELHAYADMPMRGVGNLPWSKAIAGRCRQGGRRVLMNGSSGNGTISLQCASILFRQWFRKGQWLHLSQEYRKYIRRHQTHDRNPLRRFFGSVVRPQLPDWLDVAWSTIRSNAEQSGYQTYSAIHPEYAEEMKVAERMEQFHVDDRFRPVRSRRELLQQLMDNGTSNYTDGFSEPSKQNSGVQGRDPLGDRKIMEFCYGLPDDQFFKNGVDRRLIKRMLASRLPQEILHAQRGDQGADWHGRMSRSLKRIEHELDRLADDPVMSKRLDIDRMRKAIRDWPDHTPRSLNDHPEFAIMRLAIPRAISVARFINRVEGKNY
jgi:asparagine synthase (glutamine-hydrolysing)